MVKRWTQEEWDQLSSHEKYLVYSSLRGPDIDNDDMRMQLKWKTTAIIRYAMLDVLGLDSAFIAINDSVDAVTLDEKYPEDLGLAHFTSHVKHACRVLGIPIVYSNEKL